MKKEQLIPPALLLLFSFALVGLFAIFDLGKHSHPGVDNNYLQTLRELDSESVKLECKKKITLVEVLPESLVRHECVSGKILTLNKQALYVTIRVPQGQLIIDLGKE